MRKTSSLSSARSCAATTFTGLINLGLAQGAKFICLGDYANSRGAADMGLYPDMLPGYAPVSSATSFHEDWVDEIPASPGLNLLQMMDAAKDGKLKALYVVGSNPVARYNVDPFALSKAFVVVQDMFLTETASIADVVLPVANAYEKGGTFTNTCGDVQMLKKAGEFAGVRNDFECIVRIADRMGYHVHKLVSFGGGGTRPTWARPAARNRAKPTGTRCGSPSTIWSLR